MGDSNVLVGEMGDSNVLVVEMGDSNVLVVEMGDSIVLLELCLQTFPLSYPSGLVYTSDQSTSDLVYTSGQSPSDLVYVVGSWGGGGEGESEKSP